MGVDAVHHKNKNCEKYNTLCYVLWGLKAQSKAVCNWFNSVLLLKCLLGWTRNFGNLLGDEILPGSTVSRMQTTKHNHRRLNIMVVGLFNKRGHWHPCDQTFSLILHVQSARSRIQGGLTQGKANMATQNVRNQDSYQREKRYFFNKNGILTMYNRYCEK